MQEIHYFKIINLIPGAHSSKVELIEDENGKKYVLKTVDENSIEEKIREIEFLEKLSDLKLPAIKVYDSSKIKNNQFILEYLDNSSTLGDLHNKNYYFKFGQYLNILHKEKYNKSFKFNKEKIKINVPWSSFVQESVDYCKNKLDRIDSLILSIKEQIIQNLEKLKEIKPIYSIIHGDLHTNNVLVKNNEIYLFDSSSFLHTGDFRYDYCRVASCFPNIFGNITNDPDFNNDLELWNSFCEGYGLVIDEVPDFYMFLLLVCVERISNHHTPYMLNLVQKILILCRK